VGTPQSLYYEPATPFVAGFVGANNRIDGKAVRAENGIVEVASVDGMTLFCRANGAVAAGTDVSAFVRPEVARLARSADALPGNQPRYAATVESLLFDGANSAALVRENGSRTTFHIALPQTGQFADLRVGESVAFGFDPQRAISFPR
jgi:spermidine/putrescine transport system ATP-binding protein